MQRLLGLAKQASTGLQCLALESALTRAAAARGISSSHSSLSDPVKDSEKAPATQFDHATGMEKAELEGLKQGKDIFHEDWITADFKGTPDDPVVVSSAFTERVVGVPDPEDDCLVIWSVIKADEPPRQIIPGGEYFVLKQETPESWTSIPESFKGDAHHH